VNPSGLGEFRTDDLMLAASLRIRGFRLAEAVAADGSPFFVLYGSPDRLKREVARHRLGRLSSDARDFRANDRFIRWHLGPNRRGSSRRSRTSPSRASRTLRAQTTPTTVADTNEFAIHTVVESRGNVPTYGGQRR